MKDAQVILKNCTYAIDAKYHYDVMRGGFIWDDELPSRDKECTGFFQGILLISKVIAYRASLTLGEPIEEYEQEWLDLQAVVPNWPGFREERIYGRIERELRVVKRKEEKCFEDIDLEI